MSKAKPNVPIRSRFHVVNAAIFSLQGFARLLKEKPAKIEIFSALICAAILVIFEASILEWLIFFIIMLCMLAFEAVNTALEIITDKISPEWSLEAKHIKDLGSLSVGLVTLCLLAHMAYVIFC